MRLIVSVSVDDTVGLQDHVFGSALERRTGIGVGSQRAEIGPAVLVPKSALGTASCVSKC